MTGRHFTDADLAERHGKSIWFVQKECRSGRWPHLRVGKSYRFTAEHVATIDAHLEVGTTVAAPVSDWGRKRRASP